MPLGNERGRKFSGAFNGIQNQLLKAREGDTDLRQTRETKVENDLAWAREDLKEKRYLSMPEHGIWQITELGREILFTIAKRVYAEKPDESFFQRLNEKFIAKLFELGCKLSQPATAA